VLDFSCAFDTVSHERLLGKLDHCGIRGNIKEWIQSLLCDRQMWIAMDGDRWSIVWMLSRLRSFTGDCTWSAIVPIIYHQPPGSDVTMHNSSSVCRRLSSILRNTFRRRSTDFLERSWSTEQLGNQVMHAV